MVLSKYWKAVSVFPFIDILHLPDHSYKQKCKFCFLHKQRNTFQVLKEALIKELVLKLYRTEAKTKN